MDRYICVHGHFYQPPRENAWLEYLEVQDAAYPYHDWNERVTAECYESNTASHILNGEGEVTQIVNNYAKMSFNFGPTLLSWMQENAPDVYQAILDSDRESQKVFSGHGSALAQVYNHVIMPLANQRDKYTQVIWGIRDFEYRFGRRPEGMWLPETAVDISTLEVLADMGLQFTILAPHQARRVRPKGSKTWLDVSGSKIDPTMAYEVALPSGRRLALFFYDGPTSRAVAFEGLLSSGEKFAARLTSAFSDQRTWPQLVHIATDGETYGHHHRFGDMALAYALHYIEANGLARITNYSQYLENCPPTHEVEIVENSSWSCAHGIERWRSDCSCSSGMHPQWNQAWRGPLRDALDWLRDTLAVKYEEKAGQFLADPWAARNEYVRVVLDRSPETIQLFVDQHALRQLDDAERITLLKLLEMQRHTMLMYTSCGWFFDELSGIETVQVIQYAARAIQLAEELFGEPFDPQFLDRLEKAKSNIREHGDGCRIYEKFVKPAMVDLTKVAAHYAVSSLFEDYGEQATIYCYDVELEDYRVLTAGKAKLAAGRARFTSQITTESGLFSFGVLHFGDHNLNAGVRLYQGEKPYRQMLAEVFQPFETSDLPQVIRLLDKHFGESTYSMRSLFRDEQRKVLNRILESTLAEVEASFRQVYDYHYPLMRFLSDLGNPPPEAFRAAATFIVNTDLRREVSGEPPDPQRVAELLQEAKLWKVELDAEGLSYLLGKTLVTMIQALADEPEDLDLLRKLAADAALAGTMPAPVDLWKVQNQFYEMLWTSFPGFNRRSQKGDETAGEWVAEFRALAKHLSMRIE